MMLDNKGRLFGKVSLIDLFVLIAALTAVVFVYKKLDVGSISTAARGDKVIMKFYAEQAPACVGDNLKEGDKVMDEAKGVDFGQIVGYEVGEGYEYNPDTQGNLIKSPKPEYCSVEISSEVVAQLYENGVIVDGNRYGVGHSLTILAGKTKIYLKISGIEAA